MGWSSLFSVTAISFGLAGLYILTVGKNIYGLFRPDISNDPDDPKPIISPRWVETQHFDLVMYASAEMMPRVTDSRWKEQYLLLQESDMAIQDSREWTINISTSTIPSLDNNGTVWVHAFWSKTGLSPHPGSDMDPTTAYARMELTKYMDYQENATRNLLTNKDGKGTKDVIDEESENALEDDLEEVVGLRGTKRVVTFYKTRIPLKMVDNWDHYPTHKIPNDFYRDMRIDRKTLKWGPVAYMDSAWLKTSEFVVVNVTTDVLPVKITYHPISLGFFRLSNQMANSFEMIGNMVGEDETEADQLKEMFSDTNPYLLALTLLVSVLHMLFDVLAFKNEVHFWKNRKTYEGLSGRTMALNLVCQFVIFLYLADNDASVLVLITSAMSLLIEGWKLTRIFRLSLTMTAPFIKFGSLIESESSTHEHDSKALKYMSIIMSPIIVGYAVYSLLYSSHKSWYSWILGSFASAMYVGGFVLMTPQLFINYKLKSVAHLPWRVFVYKALNTFIDDLFAFIITMPTMHRLSVFRDDLVFFIYLYQRWIYPVDKNRVEGMDSDEAVETTPPATTVETTPSAAVEAAPPDIGDKPKVD